MSANIRGHPRRPTADQSVSLVHSPRARLQQQLQQNRQHDSSSNHDTRTIARRRDSRNKFESNSPSSLNPLTGKLSSGESSNAERWFDESNNEGAEKGKTFADDDPPFFMRNPSSEEEQVEGQDLARQYQYSNDLGASLQMRTAHLQLGTDASSTEDFRSVIDDLTIENKKLKRRLKRYEKLHDTHLKDEKLFELRVHGLPPDRKRELEETLRKFATEMSGSRSGAEFPTNGYRGLQPLLRTHGTASSSTSVQNTDSAYASMSASGRGSSAGGSKQRKPAQSQSNQLRHENIHSYLHHIPGGLLPRQNPENMSERARKKLVVRRLEQIFAGKGAALSGHQQALQQQDVSHSAAHADRVEQEAQGQRSHEEGVREASIMEEMKARSHDIEATTTAPSKRPFDARQESEQRPTRPLDLDPHRAQVPAENVRYMRHLGFTLPDAGSGSPQDDEGWVYLNLLVNMAQLHTTNVTADFVREATRELSDRLELSDDGRKVRWKGGSRLTRTSSDGGDSTISRTDDDSGQSPSKRVKLGTGKAADVSRSSRYIPGKRPQASESNRFAYTPLFFHKDSTGEEDSSSDSDEDDDGSSPFPQQPIGGDSSGMTSSGMRTSSTKQKKHDDGPIIFYNNARFCTDLSGDARPALSPGAPIYKAANVAPIGLPKSSSVQEKLFDKRGPLAETSNLPEPMALDDDSVSGTMELELPLPSPVVKVIEPRAPIDFEVTGMGGVYPADNFSIAVESQVVFLSQASQPVSGNTRTKALPPRFSKLLSSDKAGRVTSSRKVVSRREMPPSTLPPALSFMVTGSDSFSDDGSEVDERMSEVPDSPGAMTRLAAPQQFNLPYSHNDDSNIDVEEYEDGPDDDDDAGSDGSLDLLATARKLDPEAVRAWEREYDANIAERLAEEIPAGSSAATAGGGSGFASPASGIGKAMYRRAKNEARANQELLKQHETMDNMTIMQDLSSSPDDAESSHN